MFRKVFLASLAFFLLFSSTSYAYKAWRYREHATDCTALTDGKESDICRELDSEIWFACYPSSGDCDSAGEWVLLSESTTAGDYLTLTGEDIDLDSEIYTDNIFTFNLESPVTDDDGDFGHPGLANTWTVTKVTCNTDTGTATINIEERAGTTPNTAGTDILSADLVCDADGQTSCASGCDVNTITNAGLDANDALALMISAVASSPTKLRVTIIGTKDD